MNLQLLSVVFSFRNEEDNIPALVSRVTKSIQLINNINYELIFVNDDSTDNSKECLSNLINEGYPITIINMSRNFGGTPCILAGFKYAKGDMIIYMDSDLQDPPELIPKMIQKYREGYEVVHTRRLTRDGESKFKLWLTKKAYSIINFSSEFELPKNVGDFKLLSKKVVDEILKIEEYDPYLRGLSIWVGFKQGFVEYNREARYMGDTKFPIFKSNGPAKEFLRGLLSNSGLPLITILFIGIIAILLSFTLIIYSIIIKITDETAVGIPSIIITISFFSGLIIFTNVIIELYMSRIYNQIKGRPKYIIESVYSKTITK
jgi:glycosyltransferase involved in cell wall biosynthesis